MNALVLIDDTMFRWRGTIAEVGEEGDLCP
jgi:hypothetical protein